MLFKRSFSYLFVIMAVLAGMQDHHIIYDSPQFRDSFILHALKYSERAVEKLNLDKKSNREKAAGSLRQLFQALASIHSENNGVHAYPVMVLGCLFIIWFANNTLRRNNVWKLALF